MDVRERFEYWYSDEGRSPKAVERNGDGYKLIAAQTAWTAWQAACNSQREHDADIALKVASSFGAPDAYWIFADTIRDQEMA